MHGRIFPQKPRSEKKSRRHLSGTVGAQEPKLPTGFRARKLERLKIAAISACAKAGALCARHWQSCEDSSPLALLGC